MVVALTLTFALLDARSEQIDVEQHAREVGTMAAAMLAQEESTLLRMAHLLASSRTVEEGLAGGSGPLLHGDLVAAQVSEDLDFAVVVDPRGRPLAEVNLPARLLSQTRAVETAQLLLDTTTIEWIDEGAGEQDVWLLAAAVHRRSDGLTDGAVVIGREVDEDYLRRFGAVVGVAVSIRLDGRTAGPAALPDTVLSAVGYRSLYGGDLQLLVHYPLAASREAVTRGVLLVAGGGILALVAFLLLSTALVRRVVRPFDRLASAATRIAAGERGARVPVRGASEVIATSRAFNSMVSALEARQDELAGLYEAEAASAVTMEYRALHDHLTGLPNRALFHDRLGQAVAAADRGGTEVALLLMDMDAFKDVNDTHGHSAGDALLTQIGPLCAADLRQTDTLARLGGDEFAIILPGAGAGAASRIAERIQQHLERPFAVNGLSLRIGASVGIAVYPLHARDGEQLLIQADLAMYEAKKKGSRVCVYSPALERGPDRRRDTVAQLRQLLEVDGLELHYQPIVSLRDGRVEGLEALARWNHPERGWIPPDEFIPLAEQAGLIKTLTRGVLRTALRQAVTWWRAGYAVPIGVNLSMLNLLDPDLCRTVRESLTEAGARAEMLRLEITESATMEDPERAVACTAGLRAMGIRIAIDDFGTGYSSLSYLHRLQADEVKIDRSFVATMASDESSRTIARVTIALAKALGLGVVAEGVEDEPTLRLLRAMGSDAAQGFLIARPMPAEAVLPWIDAATVVALFAPVSPDADLGEPAVAG